MKLRLLFVPAILGAAVGVLVLAGGSSGQGSPYDSVHGAVKVTFPDFPAPGESTTEQLVISAQDGPNGPEGSIEFRSPLSAVPVALVDVTCLRVLDNDAWVGGPVRQPFDYGGQSGFPVSRITHLSVQIHDNGSPGKGVPDGVHPVVFVDRPRPPEFSPCNITQPMYPVDQGNLVVYAASSN